MTDLGLIPIMTVCQNIKLHTDDTGTTDGHGLYIVYSTFASAQLISHYDTPS